MKNNISTLKLLIGILADMARLMKEESRINNVFDFRETLPDLDATNIKLIPERIIVMKRSNISDSSIYKFEILNTPKDVFNYPLYRVKNIDEIIKEKNKMYTTYYKPLQHSITEETKHVFEQQVVLKRLLYNAMVKEGKEKVLEKRKKQ